MRLTIIAPDNMVGIDGQFFDIDLSGVLPEGVHAVQWYGDAGEIEFNDGRANLAIPALAGVVGLAEDALEFDFQPAVDAWHAAHAAANQPPTFEGLQAGKIGEINAACEAAITAGFESSALGSPHLYQSEREDQLNLIGMVADGLGGPFKCRDAAGVWEFREHTHEQLQQVITDGKAVKLALLQRAHDLKAQAANAETVAELAEISW